MNSSCFSATCKFSIGHADIVFPVTDRLTTCGRELFQKPVARMETESRRRAESSRRLLPDVSRLPGLVEALGMEGGKDGGGSSVWSVLPDVSD
ncbi:hypothetical protein BgiMline_003021 [Biomphalaria glabrata]|nr:hypothetical protein BgiMline_011592 [Biomphalaria glabrata]